MRVDRTDLRHWAQRRDAEGSLPLLIRKLVWATVDEPRSVEFPAGEAVQLRGWDGRVEALQETPHVPDGVSAWELSTRRDCKTKADEDYAKRTDAPGDVDRESSTFVFVTPCVWAGKHKWAKARRAEGKWQDVRAYDADDLESWLERAPGVSCWLARHLGVATGGMLSLDDFWEDWSTETAPPVTAGLLLAGREAAAAQIRRWLTEAPGLAEITGSSPEEAIAFLAAVFSEPGSERHLARAVVVESEDDFRMLEGSSSPLILIPRFERVNTKRATQSGHHVFVGKGGTATGRRGRALPPLDIELATAALVESGLEPNEARRVVERSSQRIDVLRRQLAPGDVSTPGEEKEVEEEQREAAERRWHFIQSHAIERIELLFILKGSVGVGWLHELLEDTRLTFSRDQASFRLSQCFTASPEVNTRETSSGPEQCICALWELYEPKEGYWVKRIARNSPEFHLVAGFDSSVPWAMLGVTDVVNLEDLARLPEIGVSIPARAYRVGVEEFAIRLVGETFSFSVSLADEGLLEGMHSFARTQYKVASGDDDLMPVGTGFGGIQLLGLFRKQLLPDVEPHPSKHRSGIVGLAGPDGRAISFYPSMPKDFMQASEHEDYTFKVTVPKEFDSGACIEKLEDELAGDPTSVDIYTELAKLYNYEGRTQDEIKCLAAAIEQAPPSGLVHAMMGQALAALGRHDEALEHYERAAELWPDDALVQAKLGVTLDQLGELEAALDHFKAATQLEPDEVSHHINLCTALLRLESTDEALAPARRAVELAPTDAKSMYRLGLLLDHAGSQVEARQHLRRAAELEPDSACMHGDLGRLLGKAGKHEEAAASLRRSLQLEETARGSELLGASLGSLGLWAEAEIAFRRAAELEPNDARMLANHGAALANLDRVAEAAEMYEKSLSLDPTDAKARFSLEWLRKKSNPE